MDREKRLWKWAHNYIGVGSDIKIVADPEAFGGYRMFVRADHQSNIEFYSRPATAFPCQIELHPNDVPPEALNIVVDMLNLESLKGLPWLMRTIHVTSAALQTLNGLGRIKKAMSLVDCPKLTKLDGVEFYPPVIRVEGCGAIENFAAIERTKTTELQIRYQQVASPRGIPDSLRFLQLRAATIHNHFLYLFTLDKLEHLMWEDSDHQQLTRIVEPFIKRIPHEKPSSMVFDLATALLQEGYDEEFVSI